MNFRELVYLSQCDAASNASLSDSKAHTHNFYYVVLPFQETLKEGSGFNCCRGKKIISLQLLLIPNFQKYISPFHAFDGKKKKKAMIAHSFLYLQFFSNVTLQFLP